jgi:hypothetical protein
MYGTFSPFSFWLKEHSFSEAVSTFVIRKECETYSVLSNRWGQSYIDRNYLHLVDQIRKYYLWKQWLEMGIFKFSR